MIIDIKSKTLFLLSERFKSTTQVLIEGSPNGKHWVIIGCYNQSVGPIPVEHFKKVKISVTAESPTTQPDIIIYHDSKELKYPLNEEQPKPETGVRHSPPRSNATSSVAASSKDEPSKVLSGGVRQKSTLPASNREPRKPYIRSETKNPVRVSKDSRGSE